MHEAGNLPRIQKGIRDARLVADMTSVHHPFPDFVILVYVSLIALRFSILLAIYCFLTVPRLPRRERTVWCEFIFIHKCIPNPHLGIALHTVSAQ